MKEQGSQKRILIVEDDTAISGILKKKLERENFIVTTAEDGYNGLQKALSEKPDLMLLDIILPVMDGMSLLKKLRQDPHGKDLPVLVLTNLVNDPDRLLEAAEYGSTDYLVKVNWNINDLVAKVKDTLGA